MVILKSHGCGTPGWTPNRSGAIVDSGIGRRQWRVRIYSGAPGFEGGEPAGRLPTAIERILRC